MTGGEPPPERAPAARRASLLSRTGHLEYDRVLFFSDAVFAIAITLLVIDLPSRVSTVTIDSGHQLRTALPRMAGFGISFAVIGLFWLGHHSMFRYIIAFDRRLILLNLLFLGTIAFLPYPTELLSSTSSSQPPAVIFYAACGAAAGLTEAAVWFHATRTPELAVPGISNVRRYQLLRILRTPAVFLLSIPVAVVRPVVAAYMWIGIVIAGLILNRVGPSGEPGLPSAGEPGLPSAGEN